MTNKKQKQEVANFIQNKALYTEKLENKILLLPTENKITEKIGIIYDNKNVKGEKLKD